VKRLIQENILVTADIYLCVLIVCP